MIQKKAISLIEGVMKIAKSLPEEKALQMQGLIASLASFDLSGDVKIGGKQGEYNSHLAVIHNFLTRGLPTFPSKCIEEKIAVAFGKTSEKRDEILGEFSYQLKDDPNIRNLIFESLHLVDPRMTLDQEEYNTPLLESNFEKDFMFRYLTLENRFLRQFLLPQRLFTSIVNPNRSSGHMGQRVDLSIELPYLSKTKTTDRYGNHRELQKPTGFVIEIDGPQHRETVIEDNNRDAEANEAMWKILRVRSGSEQDDINSAIGSLIADPYLATCKEISNRSLNGEWIEILQMVLTPVAVSRLQSVLVDYSISHPEFLENNKRVKIGIIERDVPCGNLALADLSELISNLQSISEDIFSFPLVDMDVYSSAEFMKSPLHSAKENNKIRRIEDFPIRDHTYDLIIDISVLRRSLIEIDPKIKNCIMIRSSHFTERDNRRVNYTSRSIQYKPLINSLQNDSYELIEDNIKPLEYFLRNIFRKMSFLDGQLLILNRALQNKSVIGLLPTGGGKSLTYQLASMLQPGIVLVVDPIKSLMQDQFENLRESGIDSAIFINSTLTTTERKINTAKLETGQVMFCFVSPERLIIKEFRDALSGMHKNKIFFSYCVIDEVHCVSEWGHDFRTAYLSLGKNAVDYCKTGTGNPVPIFGLTATASFDVLADVERELSYKSNIGIDAIVRRENTIRDEIQYRIIDTEGDFEIQKPFSVNGLTLENVGPLTSLQYDKFKNDYIEKDVNIWKLQELVGLAKKESVNKLVFEVTEDLKDRFDKNNLTGVLEQSFDKFLEEKDINELFRKHGIPSSEKDLLKQKFINEQLERITLKDYDPKRFYNEECTNANIIFCPHRAWYFGVTDRYKWQRYPENVLDNNGHVIHRKGELILDTNNNKVPVPPSERHGIADSLNDPRFKVGTFIGSGGGNEKEEKMIQEDSFENQTAFIENKLNMMVATKAFGMGINKRNIRCTMHINMPSSLEGFVQEGGRAGRDRKLAVNYILINNQNFSIWDDYSIKKLQLINKKEELLTDNEINKILEILTPIRNKYFFREQFETIFKNLFKNYGLQQVKSVLDCIPIKNFDKDILMYFHNRSFKGKDKEKAVLFELRDKITFPNSPRIKILEEKIKEELLIDELSISLWKEERIYFNAGFQNSFGYLNLVNLQTFSMVAKGYEAFHSNQILQMALTFISENYTGPNTKVDRAKWLSEKQLIESESGIERWVVDEKVLIGTERTFKVHFENLYIDDSEYIQRLYQFWSKVFQDNNLSLSNDKINECLPEDEDVEQYINNIENKFNLNITDLLSENQLNSLEIRFYSKRRKEDTDKAIYRLQSMGLIDDYTVDYNNKMYSIKVVKKEVEEYVEALYEFIKRYYSEVKARREIEKIDQSDKAFIIRNCINFLTEFIYNEIEKKRRVAIVDMIDACKEGSDENNLVFKEYVYTYFNSKFARQFFFVNGTDYSLLSEENTDNGKIQSFEIVWKFINAVNGEVTGSQVDNLKHLRGACLRILRSNPDNASLNLLKAYALFILAGKNENLLTEASSSYFKGFTEFRSYYNELATEEFNLSVEKYKDLVLEHTNNQRVKEIIEKLTNLFYLQLTADKFHQFKTKFIEDYGR